MKNLTHTIYDLNGITLSSGDSFQLEDIKKEKKDNYEDYRKRLNDLGLWNEKYEEYYLQADNGELDLKDFGNFLSKERTKYNLTTK